MTVRELIIKLLETPLNAEVLWHVEHPGDSGEVAGILQVERPGASPHGQAYVTLAMVR